MSGSIGSLSSGGSDINKTPAAGFNELKGILGSDVTSATPVARPLDSSGGSSAGIGEMFGAQHEGMKVETGHGDFLVHKGKDFGGTGGDTVVTPAENMSSAWKETGASRDLGAGNSVSDFIQAGGKEYNLLGSGDKGNCIDATKAMGEIGK